jgi:transketolase
MPTILYICIFHIVRYIRMIIMKRDIIADLELKAALCRRKIVRMVEAGGAGHMGGAMSCMDIVTALYFHIMKVDPNNPKDPDRDRFILSAGHKCMAQYAALAQKGFFEENILDTSGSLHTRIPGHPDMNKLPGIEANTGALGHGLAIGLGMALGLRLEGKGSKTFVIMGDGELAEGSNWEAIAAAAHHRVDSLTVIVDYNGLQISGKTADIMNLGPVASRFAAFGWSTAEIDGNNMAEIVETLEKVPFEKGKPSIIVANTVKGKGLSFAEDLAGYHYWRPNEEELNRAIMELDDKIKEVGV